MQKQSFTFLASDPPYGSCVALRLWSNLPFSFPCKSNPKCDCAIRVNTAHMTCLRRRKMCLTLALAELVLASSLQERRMQLRECKKATAHVICLRRMSRWTGNSGLHCQSTLQDLIIPREVQNESSPKLCASILKFLPANGKTTMRWHKRKSHAFRQACLKSLS